MKIRYRSQLYSYKKYYSKNIRYAIVLIILLFIYMKKNEDKYTNKVSTINTTQTKIYLNPELKTRKNPECYTDCFKKIRQSQ
uniref:Uncharacterized protein n=1 Tax=Meloidogyne enterolobii TaxID=390850 RepID=A0A6V7W1I9_MELEN|nr:unnamed protein product [Meloidogyne enterolobii]